MTILEQVPLSKKTSLRVGGVARFWCRVTTLDDLHEALNYARDHALPLLVLGGGTNIIPADTGFSGLVIEIGNTVVTWDEPTYRVRVGAGVLMADLVSATTERGWAGLAWAGGLPGTLGGAIRGNAGAFGGEIRDSVVSVLAIDPTTGDRMTYDQAACEFGYRTSRFKQSSLIIWSVELRFAAADASSLMAERDKHILYRQTHHATEPSAGSIFQNLYIRDLPTDFFERFPELVEKVRGEKLAAGALLDLLGMKGRAVGGAVVSQRHANMIINAEGLATSTDIRALADQMKNAVRDRYGITLHEEPEFLN